MQERCRIQIAALSGQMDDLRAGKDIRLAPYGRSMLPSIREGRDTLVIRQEPCVGVGDIVLLCGQEGCFVHRVVDINQNLLTLMDDADLYCIMSCTAQEVIGTVVYIIRGRFKFHPGRGILRRAVLPIRRLLNTIIDRNDG